MGVFEDILAERLASSGIHVTENCKYWKPTKVILSKSGNKATHRHSQIYTNLELCRPPDGFVIRNINIGRAVNQYFIQKKIAQTNSATLWLCYDILDNELLCMKMYHITACKRERAVRFYKDDTQVITFLDKLIDEIIFHSYLQEHKGVAKVKEVIVNSDADLIYFIMSYYPSQLMHYDPFLQSYSGPCFDDSDSVSPGSHRHLYKENFAKRIFKQLVETVEFFHENGVIHKDIKPENILLTCTDANMFETVFMDEDDCSNEDHLSIHSDEIVEHKLTPQEIADLHRYFGEGVGCSVDVREHLLGFVDSPEFPYGPSISSDFYWCIWEDVELVVDFTNTEPSGNSFEVGHNSIAYAREIVKEFSSSNFSLYDYFTSGRIPYKINECFLKGGQSIKQMHRDPEPNNAEQLCVITDFGVAYLASVENGKLVIFDSEGSLAFTSPESLKCVEGSIPGRERDVFSLGVTLYCMIYGKLPYYGNGGIQMLMNMLETPLSFHPYRKISQELKSLISGMLQIDHKYRLSLREVLAHSWLNS